MGRNLGKKDGTFNQKGAKMIWNNFNRLRAKIANFFREGKRQKVFEFPLRGYQDNIGIRTDHKGYDRAMFNRIAKRRAANKVARKARRVNRLRAA
jgi:hypothetical protein